MKDAKHTPGPWVYEGGMNANMMSCVTAPQSDEYIDIAYLTLSNHHANAHLIAAAPELLEALERMVALFLRNNGEDIANARAAIAKAKGETT